MIKLSFPHPKESLYELLNLNGPVVLEKMFENIGGWAPESLVYY